MPRLSVLLLMLVTAAPARAQMDWLGPHLDSQRWNRLREHQMRGQQPPGGRQPPGRAPGGSQARQPGDVSEQQSLRATQGSSPRRQP